MSKPMLPIHSVDPGGHKTTICPLCGTIWPRSEAGLRFRECRECKNWFCVNCGKAEKHLCNMRRREINTSRGRLRQVATPVDEWIAEVATALVGSAVSIVQRVLRYMGVMKKKPAEAEDKAVLDALGSVRIEEHTAEHGAVEPHYHISARVGGKRLAYEFAISPPCTIGQLLAMLTGSFAVLGEGEQETTQEEGE